MPPLDRFVAEPFGGLEKPEGLTFLGWSEASSLRLDDHVAGFQSSAQVRKQCALTLGV